MEFEPITEKQSTDTGPGIEPFRHVVAGIHIGPMTPRPVEGEFDSILTLARHAGHVPDLVRHRHMALTYSTLPVENFHIAIKWVEDQLEEDRKILVRSEGGKQRPALVAGAVIIRLGGSYVDALALVRKANAGALTDFRYLEILKLLDKAVNHRSNW